MHCFGVGPHFKQIVKRRREDTDVPLVPDSSVKTQSAFAICHSSIACVLFGSSSIRSSGRPHRGVKKILGHGVPDRHATGLNLGEEPSGGTGGTLEREATEDGGRGRQAAPLLVVPLSCQLFCFCSGHDTEDVMGLY